jgi:hypothetical protein
MGVPSPVSFQQRKRTWSEAAPRSDDNGMTVAGAGTRAVWGPYRLVSSHAPGDILWRRCVPFCVVEFAPDLPPNSPEGREDPAS